MESLLAKTADKDPVILLIKAAQSQYVQLPVLPPACSLSLLLPL